MRLVIFSDIHGNLESLEEFLKISKVYKPDKYICLGDIVGYGADPNECCKIVREVCDIVLIGNHDAAVCGFLGMENFNNQAISVIKWTKEVIEQENLFWLFKLPYTFNFSEYGLSFFHGAPYFPSNFYYLIDKQHIEIILGSDLMKYLNPVIFFGHSHMIRKFRVNIDTKELLEIEDNKIIFDNKFRYFISVGSVGQPRDNNPKGCFFLYDTSENFFEIIRYDYDVVKASEKIKKVGFDDNLAFRLIEGK